MLDDLLMNIKEESRIILCGAISNYNHVGKDQNKNEYYRLKNYPRLIIKRAVMKGFIYFDYYKEFEKGYEALSKLLSEGKLKIKID
jgi:NADPH-dependent curcumin reductase CurA